jgi:hypothetical protein
MLLITWHWRAHNPEIANATWWTIINVKDAQDLIKLNDEQEVLRRLEDAEHKYGSGAFSGRRDLLAILLAKIHSRGIPLEPLVRALENGRRARDTAALSGEHIDGLRRFKERQDRIVKNLKLWSDRYLEFAREHTNPPDFPLSTAKKVLELRQQLEQDPLLTISSPVRRPRAGKPAQPWLSTTRQALRRARVSSDFHQELLMAVGLIPFCVSTREKPDTRVSYGR